VLTATVQQLGQALDVTSAYVVEVKGSLATTVAEYYGPAASDKERLSDLNLAYPVGVFVHALEAMDTGQSVRVSISDERTAESEREHLRQFGGNTALIVPLMRQGRALGYVRLWDSRGDRTFTDAELWLAQSLAGSAAVALENARLYASARQRAEQMQVVNDIGRDISGILEMEALLAQVCRRLEHSLGYYHVKVGLITGSEIAFPARTNKVSGLTLPAMRYALDGHGLVAWVARNSLPRYVPVVSTEPDFRSNPLLPATVSEAVIPLTAHDRTLGVLDLQSDHQMEFGPEESAVLEAVSGQVAVAVDNARLFAEARQRAAEVSALLATTLTVTSALELPARLESITQQARELAAADSVSIYRLSADGATLKPIMALDALYAEETLSDVVKLGDGLIGYVGQTGVGEIFNRADLNPRALQITGTPMTPECMMVVPLSVGARNIGVMAVYREGEREFTPHDFDLLTSFAAQAAAAIENAELYQALRERAESLQATYDELAEMNRLKDEMVQNISHELRTPLTFLKGYVDLLLAGDLGPLLPEQRRSLNVVRDKTETLARLVNDIITLQAVTPANIARLPVDLLVLARKAADGVAAVAQELGVELQRDLPDAQLEVTGDALRLSQVFDNLLSNAVKFTGRGGRITLHVRSDRHWVRAEVRDNGIGIAPEFRDRIFDRFYQVDGTITRRRGGLGLGLAICKLIVEAHGGQIGVESETGQGSTFYFVLPRA
jgi:signal transduction histidine kinase